MKKNDEMIEEWDWNTSRPIGRAVSRNKAQQEGIPHEGVHLWVGRNISSEPEILFQRRAHSKEYYPDYLDITVAGHVPFGMKMDKIQKESYEEIGVSPSNDELYDLGYFRFEERSSIMFHREIQRVYIHIDERPLNSYVFNDGEVSGLFSISLKDIKQLREADFEIFAEGYDGKKIFLKSISRKDFHPQLFAESMKEYMDILIKALEELTAKGSVSVRMPISV